MAEYTICLEHVQPPEASGVGEHRLVRIDYPEDARYSLNEILTAADFDLKIWDVIGWLPGVYDDEEAFFHEMTSVAKKSVNGLAEALKEGRLSEVGSCHE